MQFRREACGCAGMSRNRLPELIRQPHFVHVRAIRVVRGLT